jgi:mannose-1-phosphate guanylyltransferase
VLDPVAVVFAGGRGNRLWPLSRALVPKQFQPILDEGSLTSVTIERLLPLLPPERIFVSTTEAFVPAARRSLGEVPVENLIVEQDGKGPATALALSLATAVHRFGDVPLFTCPSDHLFADSEAFVQAVSDMFAQVERTPDSVVMLGADPTHPDPNLGYFKARPFEQPGVFEVVEQIEKPDRAVAEDLIAAGDVYWNTMCYALSAGPALEVYRSRRPEVIAGIEDWLQTPTGRGYDGPAAPGLELEPFFEHGMRRLLVSRDLGWNDVGTWQRLESHLNAPGTPLMSTSVGYESSDVVVASMDGRPVVLLGVKDLVIVTHEDAVYVLDKEKAADVAALEQLRSLLGDDRKDLL